MFVIEESLLAEGVAAVVAVGIEVAAPAGAVAVEAPEEVDKTVGSGFDGDCDCKGSGRSTTAVNWFVSSAHQSLGVGGRGGQDVLDLMKSWTRTKRVHVSR